jgi:glycosyltransferase involved in cell wall biosynthesis
MSDGSRVIVKQGRSIAIVSPFPPPYGGMAIQARKISFLLRESGFDVFEVETSPELPKGFGFIANIRGFRTLLKLFSFLYHLHKILPHVEAVYFLTGFFNFFFWVTYPALILIKIHRKRVILSARGGEAGKFFRRYGILVGPILKSVDTISVPSGFLRDAFKEILHIEPIIIPNISDLQQFSFRERFPVQPKLLTTRNLEKMYNVDCVIKAFKEVHHHFPESLLGIVGEGSQRKVLEKMVRNLGLADCVKFYGRVEHAEIQNLYDQYDIYINASNVDNFPGSILEAFASGLPVISTRAGGIPYMVKEGVTGLLVKMNDYAALAEKVVQLIREPDMALTLARNARDECQKYSWEHVKNVLFPLLEN